jgi:hypothetical protein
MITLEMTENEATAVLGAIGIALNMLAQSVPAGQPASPEMLVLEAVQAEVMKALKD